jgi:hypothetical protein
MLVKGEPEGATGSIGAFAVEYAYRNKGACGQRPETAAYLLNFLFIQVTSALANQYSVLVIHAFLLSLLGPYGPKLVKQVFTAETAIDRGCRTRCGRYLRPGRRPESRCIWSQS